MSIRRKPFVPVDTRRRVVDALQNGFTYQQVADAFGIGVATVNRIWRRFREADSYDIGPRGGGMRRAVRSEEENKLRKIVEKHADSTYDELTAMWIQISGRKISRSAIIRAVKRLGFSLKRKTRQAAQKIRPKNTSMRRKFVRKLRSIHKRKLVFLDEAGFAASLRREKARALIGQRAAEFIDYGYTENITVCGAIRADGPVVMEGRPKAMTKKWFLSFLRNKLFPKLRPNDVLVLDNLPSHKNTLVRALARKWSIRLLYTPPYSPEFNAIEYVWRVMKERLRGRLNRASEEFRFALAGAWRALRSFDMVPIIKHCHQIGPSPQVI